MSEPTTEIDLNTQAKIETALALLNEDSPTDQWFALMDLAEVMSRRVREWIGQLKAVGLEHVRLHGDLVRGSERWYAGEKKEQECRDVPATLTRLLEITGGDMDAVAGCLSSGAWKPGAVRKLLEERGELVRFSELFEQVVKEVLVEGKATKQLLKTDERFIK